MGEWRRASHGPPLRLQRPAHLGAGMAEEGRRRKSVYRKMQGQEESSPREDAATAGSTPALVSSGFKRRQALKTVQDEVASAKEEQAQKDSKRRRTSDRESVQMQQEMEVDASHKESKRRSTGAHNSSRADAAGEEKREKKKESREERKERKEREARKAAKEALRKEKDKAIAEAKAAKDGGSSKQGKEISLPNRASPRYKGESSMTGAGGSSKHRPPALTVGGSSSGGEGGSRGVKAGKEPAQS